MYFKANGVDLSDLVSDMKIGYETLVSDTSGRNARGDSFIDVVNLKHKVYITFRYMDDTEMAKVMAAIKPYIFNVSYRDAETNALKTIKVYTGTPEPEYYTIQANRVLYKPMSLNFIEL